MNNDIKIMVKEIPEVESMTSSSGNAIANQYIIRGSDYKLFQSYRSPIAMIKEGKTYLFADWNYSRTTGKYRNMFLGENIAVTREKLASGEYIAVGFEIEKKAIVTKIDDNTSIVEVVN